MIIYWWRVYQHWSNVRTKKRFNPSLFIPSHRNWRIRKKFEMALTKKSTCWIKVRWSSTKNPRNFMIWEFRWGFPKSNWSEIILWMSIEKDKKISSWSSGFSWWFSCLVSPHVRILFWQFVIFHLVRPSLHYKLIN